VREAWLIVIIPFVLLGLLAGLIFWTVYQHSLEVPEPPPCRNQWGHDKPQEFCDRRDREQSNIVGSI
jgi:hypothetical protein